MAKNKVKVEAYLPLSLVKKLTQEKKETGVSLSGLIGMAVAARYGGDSVPYSIVNREFEDARLKDLDNES